MTSAVWGKHKDTGLKMLHIKNTCLNFSFLSDIGAWSSIEKLRCKPFHRMQVWDACSDSMITFNHPDLVQEIAYIVENDVTVSAITEQLDKLQNVEVKYKTG